MLNSLLWSPPTVRRVHGPLLLGSGESPDSPLRLSDIFTEVGGGVLGDAGNGHYFLLR